MTNDVFHHHNGVIHENAYGKNESKEGDPVECVAIEEENREGQGKGHRDGNRDDP